MGDLMGEGSFGAVFDCLGPFDQPFALKLFRPGERPYSEVRAEWQKEAERLYRRGEFASGVLSVTGRRVGMPARPNWRMASTAIQLPPFMS